jgi:RimJ/RimL family protein N-acetyltransferase
MTEATEPHSSTARVNASLCLSAPGIVMRALRAQDADLYCGLYTDSDTMRFIGPPLSMQRAASSFKAALRSAAAPFDGPLFLVIIEPASQLSLGLCAIQQIFMRRAETGVLINPAARGRGIATESLRAVIEWGFLSLPVERIWVRCSVHNIGAQRLFRTVGLSLQPAAGTERSEMIWSVDLASSQFKQEKNDVQCSRIS